MTAQRRGSSGAGAAPRTTENRRPAVRKKRRTPGRVLRLVLVMLVFFAATFFLSALISGNLGQAGRLLLSIVTPGRPKLTVRDSGHEYKISALSQRSAQELLDSLNTSYQDNLGLATAAASAAVTAGPQNQSTFQRLLTKINYTPQTLTVSEDLSRQTAFATAPGSVSVTVFIHEERLSLASLDELNSFRPDTDGTCYVLLEAFWPAAGGWQADRSALYCFALLFDRPAVFSVNTDAIDPGELLIFYAGYLAPGEAVAVNSTMPLNLQFFPYGKKQMIALAPVSYDMRPGTYTATLTAGGLDTSFTLTVKDKEFAIQYVTIDPQVVAETRTEATNQEFTDSVNPVLSEQLPDLLWQDRAVLPVPESRVLTLFGSRRYINDDVNSYRHTGLDLEAPLGTEVRAVNTGQVIFAEYLSYTGNTLIIEHGLGLKSWYYHLEEMRAAVGDTVEKNQVIGLSGQTGFAAEPHLHLNLSVGPTFINPVTAFNQPLFNEPLP